MPWVKIDDAFFDNVRNRALGPAGRDLFIAGLCYCAKGLTNGRVPKVDVPLLLAQAQAKSPIVQRLVDAGRWIDRGDHYEVDGYLLYNPTRERVLDAREKEREKKAKQRAQVPRGDNGQYSPRESPPGQPQGVPPGSPTVPVPSPPTKGFTAAASVTPVLAAAADIIGSRAAARPGTRNPSSTAAAVARGVIRDRHADAYAHLAAHPDTTPQDLADILEPPPKPEWSLPPSVAPIEIADFDSPKPAPIDPALRLQGQSSIRALRAKNGAHIA